MNKKKIKILQMYRPLELGLQPHSKETAIDLVLNLIGVLARDDELVMDGDNWDLT
jgi:hypothetical protein